MKLRSLTFAQLVSREIVSGKIASITDRWTAEVVDDAGERQELTFDQTAQPTLAEIADKLPALVSTRLPVRTGSDKAALELAAEEEYADWQRWKTTRIEASFRALPAPIITALQNREEVAWAAYLAILQAWRSAP